MVWSSLPSCGGGSGGGGVGGSVGGVGGVGGVTTHGGFTLNHRVPGPLSGYRVICGKDRRARLRTRCNGMER